MPTSPSDEPSGGPRPRPLVLIADDGPDNRIILARMLEIAGYDTIDAADGRDALARAAEHRPDLILMDLAMPDMDGWSATRALAGDEALRAIPVIAVTGHVTVDEIERATAAGCRDVLAKPIVFEQLVAKVSAHLPSIGWEG